jgi:hypothetical protein
MQRNRHGKAKGTYLCSLYGCMKWKGTEPHHGINISIGTPHFVDKLTELLTSNINTLTDWLHRRGSSFSTSHLFNCSKQLQLEWHPQVQCHIHKSLPLYLILSWHIFTAHFLRMSVFTATTMYDFVAGWRKLFRARCACCIPGGEFCIAVS